MRVCVCIEVEKRVENSMDRPPRTLVALFEKISIYFHGFNRLGTVSVPIDYRNRYG